MKEKSFLLVVAFVLISFVSGSLFAQGWLPSAKQYFEDDEYQKCIQLLENNKKESLAMMFLAFSHLQENVFSKKKYDEEKYKAYRVQLEAKLGVNDISNLLYFINLNDKPIVVKEARKLTKKTFEGVKDIEDVPKLLTFLNSTDKEARKMAMEQIRKIIEPKRKYVNEGGTMRAQDIRVMGSKELINALLENVAEGEAKKSLQLIEEPVLSFSPSYASLETSKIETKINSDIAKRKKKYPDSNWYSATGKTR